ncbi:MAG TPA: metalloregulator ArsR/SmtB family transcription factor [Planctomycetota bacterium]|nr:metalloregulator ArsR/SmtB family transcription factor [Planctomycetota bacterium]
MATALASLQTTLKLLSDPVRLRLCGLLARAELAVQELVAITGLQQSRISNQLTLLKRAGLVKDRREGTWSFHSLSEPGDDGPLSPELHAAVLQPYLDSDQGLAEGKALAAVLEQRRQKSRQAHDRLADRWVEVGQEFAAGSLRAEMLAHAWPGGLVVADLGCGAGFLTSLLAQRGAHVIAVDHSERMLQAARRKRPSGSVEFRRGELDALPLQDGEVDAAFANLVWHHLPSFGAAAAEVFRVLKPGGALVVADLLPHDAEWMREAMGDLRLGLKPDQVVAALARAGFVELRSEAAVDRYCVRAPGGDSRELPMFLVRGQKPAHHRVPTVHVVDRRKRSKHRESPP